MGLVFLRHAYIRRLAVKNDIEANLPTRNGKPRALSKEDLSRQSTIFLQLRLKPPNQPTFRITISHTL